MTVCWS